MSCGVSFAVINASIEQALSLVSDDTNNNPAYISNIEINDKIYPKQCIGECNRTSKSIKLYFENQQRNLCYDCFIDKNEELTKKYNIISQGKCLLKLK